MNTPSPRFVICPDAKSLVVRVAQELQEFVDTQVPRESEVLWALPGGSTPGLLFDHLTQEPVRSSFQWERFRFFLGDDRAVDPGHELSNYRFIQERLTGPLGVPEEHVTRWVTESPNLEVAAREYEAQLLTWKRPLDLVMLGLGPDGHTASLFPESPQLEEKEQLCVATPVASLEPHVRRVTLTFPAINQARARWFLVTGANKAEKVLATVRGERNVGAVPAQGVGISPADNVWFLDEAAAALL